MNTRTCSLSALTQAWLTLVALTLASLAFGKWTAAAPLLPLLMAVVIWAKCAIVAEHFIEANEAHPFIRRLVRIFIALAPLALIIITFLGPEISRWTTLE
jgi:predicted PurR-regulated permease PerM